MEGKSHEKEIWLESQLVMTTAYSILTIALMAVTALMDWELWMIPLLGIGLVSVWVLHISQGLTERLRIYYTILLILIEFFFFSTHSTTFFDMPILLSMALLLFIIINELPALYMTMFTYLLALVYHVFIIKTISKDDSLLVFARIALDLIAGITSFMLSRYLIKRRRQEQDNYSSVIAELKNTTRRTEDFLTNVSHEFRTPINAVTGISDVMLRNEDNPEKRKDLIAIQQAGHRLFTQISDILDYTELDTGRLQISSEPYMIASTINDLITEAQTMIKQSNLELVIDVDPQVPSMMNGDEVKVKKIIRHLIDNAFKFTKEGGIYIHIYTLKKKYGVNLCISVQDTGIGITDAHIDNLYEKFYQVDAGRSRRAGGMGLGLSIVYGMVQELGGFMYINGTEGKGTTVHISIPQEVTDSTPCMQLEEHESSCIAAYTQPKKYKSPAVREYYDTAIEHLRQGLGVQLHKATTLGELQKIQNAYTLTHIYIGREEYEEDSDYFEKLGEKICVIVIAREDFKVKPNSRIIITHKPFNGFPLTNILANGSKVYMRDLFFAEKRMICPKIRALVVDDDEMNLLVAGGILRDYQMQVTTALSGKEAISLCEENSYDIIFLDHMMPEMDGVETMHRLKNLIRYSDENMVIIALTANAVSGSREMFLQEGFDEFVAKPIEPTVFERVMRKVLPAAAIQYVAKESVKQTRYTSSAPAGIQDEEVYEEEEKAPAKDILTELENLEINVTSALQYCREDRKFFLNLIEKFADDAKKKHDEILSLYNAEDWNNYKIKVHALKSAAKTVGMDKLSRRAENLEAAAKRSDIEYIKENTAPLLGNYAVLTSKVRTLLKGEKEKEAAASAESELAKSESRAESMEESVNSSDKADGAADGLWLEKLTELKSALEAFESDKSEALAKELSAMTGKGKKEELKSILANIADFDFTPALTTVLSLIDEASQEGGAK